MPLFITRPKRPNECKHKKAATAFSTPSLTSALAAGSNLPASKNVELHDFIRLSKNERVVAPLGTKQPHPTPAPRATIPQTKRPPHPAPQRQPAPMQNFPPATPQKEPIPSSPQTAVEHFRRVNKGLPDGVMYEPLDKETLELLKSQAQPKEVAPPKELPVPAPLNSLPPVPPPADTPPPAATIAPADIADVLEMLAQDERNAFIFYSHFAKIGHKKNLSTLAQDSEMRMNNYIQILKSGFNRDFTPKETDINVNLSLVHAINLAITEEHKGLTKLSGLLDKTTDTSLEKRIQGALQKKIISQQVLFTCVILP